MTDQPTQLDPLISEFATQADADSYDTWFRAKVQEALDSKKPYLPHDVAMAKIQAMLNSKRMNRAAGQVGSKTVTPRTPLHR